MDFFLSHFCSLKLHSYLISREIFTFNIWCQFRQLYCIAINIFVFCSLKICSMSVSVSIFLIRYSPHLYFNFQFFSCYFASFHFCFRKYIFIRAERRRHSHSPSFVSFSFSKITIFNHEKNSRYFFCFCFVFQKSIFFVLK